MPPRTSSDGRRPVTAGFFHHDPEEGSIRLPEAQRVMALPASLVQSIHVALGETLRETARDVLYRTGFECALQDMLRLHQRMQAEFGGGEFDFWQMDARFILEAWWASLKMNGWGAPTLDLSALSRGLVFVELQNSAVAVALAGATQPACHLYAGLFAGALSFFTRAERHAVEIQCRVMGADSCRFVVGPGAEVDSAEVWRQQGCSATEIIRRLS